MRVFNENKTEELKEYDLEKGYLKADKIFVKYHEPIQAVEEQGHYETIAEYPNGGKDVEWVVDVKKVEPREGWEEHEDIKVFIPYTQQELLDISEKKYEQRVEQLIRQKYSVCQELSILRQKEIKIEEFNEYFSYAENCKATAKIEFGRY